MKQPSKLLIGIIAAIAVITVVIISIVVTVSGGSKDTYGSHMELAQRYLDELQYEQAIAEYRVAIEIEPHNPEAYLGLAEVYVAMGDTEKALEVLAEGYEQTESARIAARQEELAEERDLSEKKQMDDIAENIPEDVKSQTASLITFIPWSEAGLEDYVMDWQDENLEAAMRQVIWWIRDRDIMLSDVWELTELDLHSQGITNISALSSLLNLETLDLSSNHQITDISALSSLLNLKTLDLSSNRQITDISALSSLITLKSLDLRTTQITDISALSGLQNLETLSLTGNRIIDISALSGLTNLKTLNLGFNQITDISALSGLTKLEYLDLEQNQTITDISALSGLKNLKYLDLMQNQIIDINALSDLTNLETLDLSYNQIMDISVLSSLTNLKSLNLDDNQIIDINVLGSLMNLEYLNLRYNQITDISVLIGLTKLEDLVLAGGNQITDYSPLEELDQVIEQHGGSLTVY